MVPITGLEVEWPRVVVVLGVRSHCVALLSGIPSKSVQRGLDLGNNSWFSSHPAKDLNGIARKCGIEQVFELMVYIST